VSTTAGEERRGEALGYQQSATALARVIGPPIAGLLFDHVGIPAPYLLGAMLSVAAIGVLLSDRGRVPAPATG
jgi:MFS family permease